jgi:hypothetical protein
MENYSTWELGVFGVV